MNKLSHYFLVNSLFSIIVTIVCSCSEKQLYESATIQTETIDTPIQVAEIPAINYDKYVGMYKMQGASFEEVRITQEGGKIYAQATGERKVEIFPEDKNTFRVPAFNAILTFTSQKDKMFSGITVRLDSNIFEGKKQ